VKKGRSPLIKVRPLFYALLPIEIPRRPLIGNSLNKHTRYAPVLTYKYRTGCIRVSEVSLQ